MRLRASTGSPRADEVIADVVSSFTTAMPNGVRGFYVAGSYAEGTAVPASDIDLIAVLQEGADQELASRVAETCIQRSPTRLDLVAIKASALADRFVALVPSFKGATLLVHGEDMRDELALPPLGVFAAAWADRARHFMSHIRRVDTVDAPLEYPDPAGEFFGYDRATIAEWYPPGTTQSTKELVAIVGSAATALVAIRGNAYVPSKGRCASLYAERVGDGWTVLVQEVHDLCRDRLQYRLPSGDADRSRLRAISSQVLGFESHALQEFSRLRRP